MKDFGIDFKRFLTYFIIIAITHLLSYSEYGTVLAYISILFGLLLIFKLRWFLTYFLNVILIFDDSSKYDALKPELLNIFTVRFLGFSLSMIWSIIVLVLLVYWFYNKRIKIRINETLIMLFLFFLMGLIRLYQIKNPMFISDVAFVINIFLGFLLGVYLFINKDKVKRYFGILIMIFLSKYLFFSLDGIYQSLNGILYTLKGESAANLIIIPFLFIITLLFRKKIKLGRSEKTTIVISLLILMSYLFISISRGRIFFILLSLLIYMIIYKKLKIAIYSVLLLVVTVLFIGYFNENMHNFVMWKLQSFSLNSAKGVSNPSITVRLLEFKNIMAEQFSSVYKIFIGTGWGGYFTSENYEYNNYILGDSSYPNEWILEDRFYKPHGTFLYVLLKYGTLGFFIFYGSIYIYSCKSIFSKRINAVLGNKSHLWDIRYVQVVLAISIMVFSLIIFTSKLQILTGLVLAMMYACNSILKYDDIYRS